MEFCVASQANHITVEEVKNPNLRDKILQLTKEYLGGLYELVPGPVEVTFSGVCIFAPEIRECCICLTNCAQDQPVEITCPCKEKYYHKACLKEWFRRKKICPTCRIGLSGIGYRGTTHSNPFGSPQKQKNVSRSRNRESPSQRNYQCDGSTHKRKSSFKSLFSALKHLREKHNISIGVTTHGRVHRWYCGHGACTASGYDFTDETLLEHLQTFHHLSVLTTK